MDEERLAKCLSAAASSLETGMLGHAGHWLRMAADAVGLPPASECRHLLGDLTTHKSAGEISVRCRRCAATWVLDSVSPVKADVARKEG